MWPVDTDNFSAYSIQISMYESADQFPHTADTHRMNEYGPEPEAPHLVSPIQAGHIYSRPEACLVTKQPAHKYSDRFKLPHLLFRTSLPSLLTNKFNKTLILPNYWLLPPAILKNAFSLSLFFLPPHTRLHPPNTLTPLHCRSRAQGASIHSHRVVIWIVFHGP